MKTVKWLADASGIGVACIVAWVALGVDGNLGGCELPQGLKRLRKQFEKQIPRGLKSVRDDNIEDLYGTAEAVPFQNLVQNEFFRKL
jgi:hypothetical protein